MSRSIKTFQYSMQPPFSRLTNDLTPIRLRSNASALFLKLRKGFRTGSKQKREAFGPPFKKRKVNDV